VGILNNDQLSEKEKLSALKKLKSELPNYFFENGWPIDGDFFKMLDSLIKTEISRRSLSCKESIKKILD
jgi:hypothetical protein